MKVKKDGWINRLADKVVERLIETGVNWSYDIQLLRKKMVYVKCRINSRLK